MTVTNSTEYTSHALAAITAIAVIIRPSLVRIQRRVMVPESLLCMPKVRVPFLIFMNAIVPSRSGISSKSSSGRSNPKTSPSWTGDTLIALVRTALTKPMEWYTCYSVSRCMARPYATMHTPQWPSACRRHCQIIVFAWLSYWPRTNLTPFASITVRS